MGRRKHDAEDARIKATIGANLSSLLEVLGLSQSAFAASVGLAPNTVNELCAGKKMLDPAVAIRIREKYGVALDYLYCGDHGSIPHLKLADAVLRNRAQRDPSA